MHKVYACRLVHGYWKTRRHRDKQVGEQTAMAAQHQPQHHVPPATSSQMSHPGPVLPIQMHYPQGQQQVTFEILSLLQTDRIGSET